MEIKNNLFSLPVLKHQANKPPIFKTNTKMILQMRTAINKTLTFKVESSQIKKSSSVTTASSLRKQKISDQNMKNSTQIKLYTDIYTLNKDNIKLKQRIQELDLSIGRLNKSMTSLFKSQITLMAAIDFNKIINFK